MRERLSIGSNESIGFNIEAVMAKLRLPKLELPLLFREFQSQANTWRASQIPVQEFLSDSHYRNMLAKIKLGMSFAPEEFGLRLGLPKDEFQAREEKMLKAADLAIDEDKGFGIGGSRVAVRWNNVVDSYGNIDFRVYRKLFDKLIKNRKLTTINVGPLKVFGYPEYHVLEDMLNKLASIPPKNSVIHPGLELAQRAMEHLDKLLSFLVSEYGAGWVSTLQLDNEAKTRYGEKTRQWHMGDEYMEKTIDIGHMYFPNAQILLNSPGIAPHKGDIIRRRSGIDDNMDFAARQRERNPRLKFVIGLDYYHEIGDIHLVRLPIIGRPDQIFFANVIGRDAVHRMVARAEQGEFAAQTTEKQYEPWGVCTDPGTSVPHAIFATLRNCDQGLYDQSIWGMKFQTKAVLDGTQTPAQAEIQKLILGISQLNQAA